MEDVAVKQGFLYLQQQQTFGKVGGGGGLGWGLPEVPGEERGVPKVPKPFQGRRDCTIQHIRPRAWLGRAPSLAAACLASPSRPQTVLFADAAPGRAGGVVEGGGGGG